MEKDTLNPDSGNDDEKHTHDFPDIQFENLPEKMAEACARAGWDKLMPVQQKALPFLLNRQDVMVQARTGSGKTGAFVLPLIEKIDPNSPKCQTLIMVPTRELAKQVAQEARMLAGDSGIKVVAVYGGVGYKEQLDAFHDGVQIVVGTPGRILDHLMRRNLVLDALKAIIFDEADRMLSVGFYPDMVEVKRYLPRKRIGSFMFSATFPPSVLRLAKEFMVDPQFLSLSSDEANVSAISHQFVEVSAMGKERKLIKLIELENPSSAIIFSNTKRNVEFTAALLSQFGFDAEGLTSDLSQNKRERLMARIKEGKLQFLVATDVAARGIDIPELSHVFMMEPPEDPESYVHRAGRTGRAGATGTAITLVDVIQKMELERIATRFKITFEELKDPTEEDVTAIIEERLTAILEKRFRKLTNIQQERVSRFLPLAKKYAENEESLALLAMLLDELYQPTLHGKPAEPTSSQPAAKTERPPKRKPARKAPQEQARPTSKNRSEPKRTPKPKKTAHPVEKPTTKPTPAPKKQEKKHEPKREQKPEPVVKDQPRKDPAPTETEAASKPRPRPRRRRRRRKKPSSK
ncbi:DEAD/DEAH box helicase [Pseudodesulfovibrio sp. JC047]|uniref:DEAD/DEAH box helicase n=1 Tax=Pseudodesulfovibrio sp. JC047 TaxID=2683199 RepID=UPI0013D7541A|nr:DEAD/DEAH box helicase [Pseudodesulfovibrio sp. JC047]NDV19896.1 DEAD/DEAH box helicase [Pseudodesulfovibrio sp. JC047]